MMNYVSRQSRSVEVVTLQKNYGRHTCSGGNCRLCPAKTPAAVDLVGPVSPEAASGISVSGVDVHVDFPPCPTCAYRDLARPRMLTMIASLLPCVSNCTVLADTQAV